MKRNINLRDKPTLLALFAGCSVAAILLTTLVSRAAAENKAPAAGKPSLTVTTITPVQSNIAATLAASGNIAAWQEAIVGAESNGLRLNDVRVNVGDKVAKGQVLATFAPETPEAELAQARASVAEAEAALADAQSNASRARTLASTGALSTQQINQYTTAEKTAEARLLAARANAKLNQVRLANTQVLAPDAGTISARSATVGAVVQGGQELFRLVRQNRLEWRAEVTAAELPKVATGQKVKVITPAGDVVAGTVRVIAPTVDPATRNVQVYVDLARTPLAKAGMFARGEFQLAESPGLTVPQQAVVSRDGFSYAFTVGGDNRVKQIKIETGRRVADRIEIRSGLTTQSAIVASGAGFLKDGDIVRLTTIAPTAPDKK
ncbi:MAG: efflux RND transporter periplasmic adaptor subunit [Rhodocyclaceae bacterium]|nr:efflux RND transporter periplasmic adaptor subunit [Rhodocyclaceae bacterium]MCA3022540.1 efflux RND transporter periplasmic adaptor subunit [Rhodocyclaceae bacterium]MCA3051712.1 efflux RND transporter periplasmic adaptor subunit [Rhodocyclaceae bacterium]MCA3054932.1 efflux RND transporter periplasmic adaptor subunit [Rhodocyclaceae bacterium]